MANNMSSRQACHAARYVVARVLRGLFWCLKYTVILPLATMALMALFVLWKDNTTPGKLLVSVDGVINPLLPDSRTDQGQAQRLGVKYFPAMMLVDPKQGSVRPLSYGFISQDDLAKQFLNVSEDFKPNF